MEGIRLLFFVVKEYYFILVRHNAGRGGGTLLVAQLVEALHYKSESRGFDSR
jgi:hypothetical protein